MRVCHVLFTPQEKNIQKKNTAGRNLFRARQESGVKFKANRKELKKMAENSPRPITICRSNLTAIKFSVHTLRSKKFERDTLLSPRSDYILRDSEFTTCTLNN